MPAWQRWLREPRAAVLIVLALVVGVGGCRRLLQGLRAQKAVRRLEEGADLTPEAIEAVAEFGRAGLMELFRLLASAPSETLRQHAGHALSVVWARDELIAEEEKAVVSRGWTAQWRGRKRYPRALRTEIPVTVSFGVPFLRADGAGISPDRLEWSYRITGARRASLESFSPWKAGWARETFQIVPGDFDTNGPHRLVLQARVRTRGLTGSWQLDLPHMPFSFEFDPLLQIPSLLTLPDDARAEEFARKVRLEASAAADSNAPSRFLTLTESLALRDPPDLVVDRPLPCDLAHSVHLEFEGVSGRFAAGRLVAVEWGGDDRAPLVLESPLPAVAVSGPGRRRVRAVLIANPELAWAEPDVRSLWPETVATGWYEVEVVRR